MITSTEVDQISAALVEFHKKDVTVTKDSKNPHYGNTFASLAANIQAADVTAAECGLFVVQLQDTIETNDSQLYDALTTRIGHSSGQFIQASGRLHLPKVDPQGQGSAMTYGRRYNYQGAYGLVGEDDDGHAAAAAVLKDEVSGSSPAEQKFRAMNPPKEPKSSDEITTLQKNKIRIEAKKLGIAEDGTDMEEHAVLAGIAWPGSIAELSKGDASKLIERLVG
jgi:hypothetical protein